MLKNLQKAPFPWNGGKSQAAPVVWASLGDVSHYVERFAAAGWREAGWFAAGYLRGGYGSQGKDGHQQARERLWLSPHCLGPQPAKQEKQTSILDRMEEE